MGSFDDAIAAYEKGLTVEPGLAMLTNGLADAKAAYSLARDARTRRCTPPGWWAVPRKEV